MAQKIPRILVPAQKFPAPDKADGHILGIYESYLIAMRRAGATPLVILPGTEIDEAIQILKTVQGLLLVGGRDIEPLWYNENPHTYTATLSEEEREDLYLPERDLLEIALLRKALADRLPVLAICRGHQLLNVVCGGTLWQDIPTQLPHAHEHMCLSPDSGVIKGQDLCEGEVHHNIVIEHDSQLYNILEQDLVAINSSHHQAIKDLAPTLRVSARSEEDQIIEGIELKDPAPNQFCIGIQGHPEILIKDGSPTWAPLFKSFLNAARALIVP